MQRGETAIQINGNMNKMMMTGVSSGIKKTGDMLNVECHVLCSNMPSSSDGEDSHIAAFSSPLKGPKKTAAIRKCNDVGQMSLCLIRNPLTVSK